MIGILSQTFDFKTDKDPRFKNHNSYIAASYVRFLESAGARVVPILYDESRKSIKEKVSKLNGLLFPGGGGNYVISGILALDQIKRLND